MTGSEIDALRTPWDSVFSFLRWFQYWVFLLILPYVLFWVFERERS